MRSLPLKAISSLIPRNGPPIGLVGFDFRSNQTEDLINAVGALILFQAGMWDFDKMDVQRGMRCGNYSEDNSCVIKTTYKTQSGLISVGIPIDSVETVIVRGDTELNYHSTKPLSFSTQNAVHKTDLDLLEALDALGPNVYLRRALEICKLTFEGTFSGVEIDESLTSMIRTQLLHKPNLKFHEAVKIGLKNYRAVFQRSLSRNQNVSLSAKPS
jgi:hypothetical protein